MTKEVNNTSNKKLSKWILVTIIFAIIIALGGTVFFISQSSAVQERITQKKLEKETFIWPDTYIASLIPVPQSTNGHIGHSSDKAFSVNVYKVSSEVFYDYCNKCKDSGFEFEPIQESHKILARDSYSHELNISYDETTGIMTVYIRLDETKINETDSETEAYDITEENLNVNYEYKDGLYIVDNDMAFTHRLVLTGKNPNARYGSKYIVLTNNPDITFDIVSRSLFSSNSNDWLTDTVTIGMHTIDDNGNIIPSERNEDEDDVDVKTQISPDGLITLTEYKDKVRCECDIDHDCKIEIISVDYSETLKDDQMPINMTIIIDDGKELWKDDYIGIPSCAWKSYYINVIDDAVYLIEYYPPEESQGLYFYSCKVFNLDCNGNENIYADISGDTEEAIDEFNRVISKYMNNAYLLISTWNGEISTNR